MAANVDVPCPSADADARPAEVVRYVSRQPILDLQGKVRAYALLFGGGAAARNPTPKARRAPFSIPPCSSAWRG